MGVLLSQAQAETSSAQWATYAWNQGFQGQGVTITVIGDFTSGTRITGKLESKSQTLRHGEWTLKEARMIAPSATMRSKDFNSGTAVNLNTGFNVLNLSYGIFAAAGLSASQIGWSAHRNVHHRARHQRRGGGVQGCGQ